MIISFFLILAIFYLAIGCALGLIAAVATFIALAQSPISHALLAAGIVWWVVLLWWGPLLVVVMWPTK